MQMRRDASGGAAAGVLNGSVRCTGVSGGKNGITLNRGN